MIDDRIRRIQRAYPQLYLACHVEHTTRRRAHGLSDRDASVLAHLDELSPVGAGSLAKHLGVGASTVTAPFGGCWTYELAPEAGATRLTITKPDLSRIPCFGCCRSPCSRRPRHSSDFSPTSPRTSACRRTWAP